MCDVGFFSLEVNVANTSCNVANGSQMTPNSVHVSSEFLQPVLLHAAFSLFGSNPGVF